MKKESKELLYMAARHVYGIAEGTELSQAASRAFDQGLSSPSLAELTTAKNPFEQKSLFESSIQELGLTMPKRENCISLMLRYHIESIADGSVSPKKGLGNMMREVFYPADIHNQTTKGRYVGNSHGIEHLVGLYWGYDELQEQEKNIFKKVIKVIKGDHDALDKETILQSNVWLEQHPIKF